MSTPAADSLRQVLLPRFCSAVDFAARQAARVIDTYPGYLPMYTVAGQWHREGERWTHWCEGFFPGILWLLYTYTRDDKWRVEAEAYTRPLEPRKFDRDVHDLGFIFGSTYLRWYRITGDPALRAVLIDAGRTLALRRQPGGYLASFIGPQSLFIDIMMNVPIIQWAANETGDEGLRQTAVEHCRVTERTIVRPDGGTAHEGLFDPATGRFLRESTHQGYRPDSAWSRGQAWALYGFTTMSRLCAGSAEGDEFLRTARRCADFYLERAPGGAVPRWDFDVPAGGDVPFDSSAAAIAASGLWDLSRQATDAGARDRYATAALKTLETLCSEDFLAVNDPAWEGILKHGVYHIHKGLGVDESVAWGEHFFVEGLVKVLTGENVGF